MLTLKKLTIQRGSKVVFSNLNAEIKTSALTIIKGKNGSGKSTLLRTIAGFTPIEEGQIKENGDNIFIDKEQWVEKLIFIDTKNGLSNELTVLENLEAWVRIKGWNANKDNLIMALESVGMQNHINLYISQCSDGLRKRAALARLYFSFINKVDFWLLDEPSNELDDLSFLLFKKLISKFIKIKGTILIASHDIKSFNVNYNILDLDIIKQLAKP
jgi:heme exporter protein A